jgi:PAS domain S-box-containing protein
MLIISARDLTILEANQSMTRQFGLNDEIIGKSYFSLLPPKQHEFNNVWHNHSEKLFKHQRDFLRSNGEIFSAEVTGSPIIFNYDRAIILLLHDITAQKQIEHELRQAKNAAEEANKLKSRFFANASHEIRTPMTAIIGLTEMALSNSQTPEQQRILRLARSSSQALLELVNDILDLSRIESCISCLKKFANFMSLKPATAR